MDMKNSKEIVKEMEERLSNLNPKLDFMTVKDGKGEMALLLLNATTIRKIELPRDWVMSEDEAKFNGIATNAIKKQIKSGIYYKIPVVLHKNVAHLPEFQEVEDIK